MNDKTREGELETTHTEEDIYNEGDLITTHLMPETTLEEKMDEVELQANRLKIEEMEKEISYLKMRMEEFKQSAIEAKKIAKSYLDDLKEKEADIDELMSQKEDLIKELSNLKREYGEKLDVLDQHVSNDAVLINTQATILTDIRKHYDRRPVFLHDWKTGLADWLSGGAVGRAREWFIGLYDILG